MKQDTEVRISEYLDDELPSAELNELIKACESEENRELLLRYQQIGRVMRKEETFSGRDISQSVAAAIAALPADESMNNVGAESVRSSHWLKDILVASWMKPAMGAAFATTIAVLTVVINQQNTPAGAPSPALAEQKVNLPFNATVEQAVPVENLAESEEVRQQLNNYLVNHARSTSGSNYQGMVPYVRAVSYESKTQTPAAPDAAAGQDK